jgi:6-phosphogluconate dehydrogenase (decarboxylating)
MNKLNILDDLLEKLKSEELIWILIPCDNLTDAEMLMRTLASKKVTWFNDGRILQPTDTEWSDYKEETLYAVSCNNDGFLDVRRGNLGSIDRVTEMGYKYAVLHVCGIIHTETSTTFYESV